MRSDLLVARFWFEIRNDHHAGKQTSTLDFAPR